jgi:hypothetical protein
VDAGVIGQLLLGEAVVDTLQPRTRLPEVSRLELPVAVGGKGRRGGSAAAPWWLVGAAFRLVGGLGGSYQAPVGERSFGPMDGSSIALAPDEALASTRARLPAVRSGMVSRTGRPGEPNVPQAGPHP